MIQIAESIRVYVNGIVNNFKKQVKMKRVKKAQDGQIVPIERKIATPDLKTSQYRRLGRLSARKPTKAKKVAKKMVERATRTERGEQYIKKNAPKLMYGVPDVGKNGLVKKKMAKGGGFPDLNKDGKVTKKDVLIGRGVLPKKAQLGGLFGKRNCGPGGCGKPASAERKAARQATRAVRSPKMPKGKFKMQSGGRMKSCRGGCY